MVNKKHIAVYVDEDELKYIDNLRKLNKDFTGKPASYNKMIHKMIEEYIENNDKEVKQDGTGHSIGRDNSSGTEISSGRTNERNPNNESARDELPRNQY